MKMKEYAQRRGWGPTETAAHFGWPLSSVNRYWYRDEIPSDDRKVDAYKKSNAMITPNDWFDFEAIQADMKAARA